MKNQGFTLTEILVSVGIWGVLISTIGTGVAAIYKSQKNVENRLESSQFSLAAIKFMQSEKFCQSSLIGKKLELNNELGRSITLSGYTAYGSTGNEIGAKSLITPNLRVNDVRLIHNNKVPAYNITIDGAPRKVHMARILLEMEAKTNNEFNQLRDQVVEFPVVTDSGGTILYCRSEMNKSEACKLVGGNYLGADCAPQASCQVQGAYSSSSCSHPGNSVCGQLSVNPVTGGYSCPQGSTKRVLYSYDKNVSVNCGKKCSYNVNTKGESVLCMRCPSR